MQVPDEVRTAPTRQEPRAAFEKMVTVSIPFAL